MTKGISAALLSPLQALLKDGFTEDTQRYLFTRLTRKSASASGITALANAGISNGDLQVLDRIAALGAELEEDMETMAELIGMIAIHIPTHPLQDC